MSLDFNLFRSQFLTFQLEAVETERKIKSICCCRVQRAWKRAAAVQKGKLYYISILVILCLKEWELFFDPVTRFVDGEFERLPGLRWTLSHTRKEDKRKEKYKNMKHAIQLSCHASRGIKKREGPYFFFPHSFKKSIQYFFPCLSLYSVPST